MLERERYNVFSKAVRVRKCTRNSIRPMQRTRQQPTTRPLQRAALSQQKKAMRPVQGLILKQDDPNNIALPLLNYSVDATELYSVDAATLSKDLVVDHVTI